MKSRYRTAILLGALIPLLAMAQDKSPYSCEAVAEHRQFDFWVGSWKVTDEAGEKVYGHNDISVGEKGCLLTEKWRSSAGGTGSSINYYNPSNKQWHQHWVDAGASIIHTAGGMEDGSMVMAGEIYYLKDARTAEFRARWTLLPDGRVRQYFEERDAEGQWQPWFEGFYQAMP